MRKPIAHQLRLPLPDGTCEYSAPAHASINGHLVRYAVKRSARRRSISLTIDENGLRVGAPLGARDRAIERVLLSHADWVVAKLREWESRRAPPISWTDGAPLMLQGRTLTLCYSAAARDAQIVDDRIYVGEVNPKAAVISALRKAALALFSERVTHFCTELGLASPSVRLSNARTRWGSCHAGGRIRLNWRMIQMPQRLVDYVVAHEVAHLREMNHSARFWAVVGRLIPDYASRRKELRLEGHHYLVI